MMKYDYRGYAFGLPHLVIAAGAVTTGAVIGVGFAALLGKYGPWAMWSVAIISFVIGTSLAAIACLGIVEQYIHHFVAFPTCRKGACSTWRSYSFPAATIYGWKGIGCSHYRCECGDEYLRLGRRFFSLTSDATIVNYKRLDWHGHWVDDDGLDVKVYSVK
ncbi:MAG TPA: hypothetical protein VGK19_21590 [Capsulimonadaceae bacterium]|jgi:hypothetical protein